MKSRLTPVCFELGRAFNPDRDIWEIGRQVVLVYHLYHDLLFKMKERRKKWYVSSNPRPMLYADNCFLQRAASKFKNSNIKGYSTYHDRVVYR